MKSPNMSASSLAPSVQQLPLFVYGTLMAPIVMETLIGRRVQGQKVKLLPSWVSSESGTNNKQPYDYSRHPVRGVVYPGLVHWKTDDIVQQQQHQKPSLTSSVTGLLYSNLSDTELSILDQFEGNQYVREICNVQLIQEESSSNIDHKTPGPDEVHDIQQAMVYVWSNPISELDLTQDWCYATFESKHLSTYL